MNNLFKSVIANYLSLYLTSVFLVTGLSIQNGLLGYTKAVVMLSIVFPILRPILKIILLPINLLTLGLFNLLTGVIVIYLLSLIIPDIRIVNQHFSGFSYGSIRVEPFVLSRFWVMFLTSFCLRGLYKVFMWMFK